MNFVVVAMSYRLTLGRDAFRHFVTSCVKSAHATNMASPLELGAPSLSSRRKGVQIMIHAANYVLRRNF